MAEPERSASRKRKKHRFPWLLLLVFLATIAFFWIYPFVRGPVAPRVIFEPAPSTQP